MNYELLLANRVYSGWGLRVWMIFEHFNIGFEHRIVPLYTDEFSQYKRDHFPARQLPALVVTSDDRQQVIWDSLSIIEFLHENHPSADIWPSNSNARAAARSICCEMHSGYKALRSKMPVNLKQHYKSFEPDAETRADIERLQSLWAWARNEFSSQGPYLFGKQFTAADAFFAPVAARFRTYSINLNEHDQAYCDLLLSHKSAIEYVNLAKTEPWVLDHNEFNID